jgi:hypothetical protein
MAKVFAKYVHVEGENGDTVSFVPGDKLPDWAVSKVTNPACFVDSGDKPESDETVEATTETAPPEMEAESTEPAEDVIAVPGRGWDSLSFPELQAAAKSRDLSGAGNTETLIARLNAADKDDAIEAAEVTAKAVADLAATTATQQ